MGHHAAASYDPQGHWAADAESIKKFELTTTSGPLWAGLTAAIDFIEGIGLEAIKDRVRALSRLAVETLTSVPGVMVTSPQHPQLASGLVSFSMDGPSPQQVATYLWEQRRIVTRCVEHPPGVRLSVDFFNTEEEVEMVAASLKCLR